MTPLITLTTDFGSQDGYVGAMKGRLLSLCPGAQLVDLSHDIPAQAIRQAAWCLARAAPEFPQGTIHLAVVDPGVGSMRSALLARTARHWLLGPDNGLFGRLLEQEPPVGLWHLHREHPHWQAHQSFDGLHVFVPAAARLALGDAPDTLGKPVKAFHHLPDPTPAWTEGRLNGEVLTFDRFGNALTNIRARHLEGLAGKPLIYVGEAWLPLVRHYAEGEGQPGMALINSDGLLELAVYCGSAQAALGLGEGSPVYVATA
ncbi:MAG: SAM-dependent chlorinase/fluorinase [Gammaproteobacteria bacterium]|nr:SAM-dependent chlorinase/fluorinase [Gammaproteobacteria bacterium]